MASTSSSAPSANTPAASSGTKPEEKQGWIEGVQNFAVGQYDNFKKGHPDAAKKIEGAVTDVAKQIDEFSFAQKEKAAMQAMDDMMNHLESDYQDAKKHVWEDWQNCKKENSEEATKIRASMQAAQESIAQAKKSAILSMRQAVNNSLTEIETKTHDDYATAKSNAEAYYKKIQASEADKAAKVKTGITDAEKKLAEKKSKCIEEYEKALSDATAKLVAARKEASEEYGKAKEGGVVAIDAAKATATKTVSAGKARVAAVTAAAQTKESVIKSNMENEFETAQVDAMAECDKLETHNAAKAEEIEKKIRNAETSFALAKKSAMREYQKAVKQVTADLQKLSKA